LLWAGIVLHAMLPLAIIRVLICSVRAARVFMSRTVSDLVSSVLGVSAVNHTILREDIAYRDPLAETPQFQQVQQAKEATSSFYRGSWFPVN
jgi:hypothetical protein